MGRRIHWKIAIPFAALLLAFWAAVLAYDWLLRHNA